MYLSPLISWILCFFLQLLNRFGIVRYISQFAPAYKVLEEQVAQDQADVESQERMLQHLRYPWMGWVQIRTFLK